MLISELAKAAKLHPETIRRLERRGLITSKRDLNGWRTYSPETLDKLKRLYVRDDGQGDHFADQCDQLKAQLADLIGDVERRGETIIKLETGLADAEKRGMVRACEVLEGIGGRFLFDGFCDEATAAIRAEMEKL